ncbi:hypothetical protein ABXJ56_12425 [Microbacterium chocolatum]|uniref:hypothetical protein n=1 Tax=Microbacterium aurantiacum TaxID=162393 RepID=UPI00338D8D8C
MFRTAPTSSAAPPTATLVPVGVLERTQHRLRTESRERLPAEEASRVVREEIRRHNDVAAARGLAVVEDEQGCEREILARLLGYGPLQPYLDDPTVEELWINAPDGAF